MERRLQVLFAARRAALEAEAAVFDGDDEGGLLGRLGEAVREARGLEDRTEGSFRLQVLADVLAKVRHGDAPRLLLEVLDDPDASVRARAVAACGLLAQDRWPELVRAIEAALADGLAGPALLELPGLLIDLADDDAPLPVDLLVRLLDDEDADVAAEAACALAELDVTGVRDLLSSFQDDPRPLSDADGAPATLGALIADLVATLDLSDAFEAGPAGEA